MRIVLLCQYALGAGGLRSSGLAMPASSSEFIRVTESCTSSALRGFPFREQCMQHANSIEGYDWCGVYRLVGDMLVLDAFVGEDTDHKRIPVGKGVCGTAVADDANQIIGDVTALQNYLFCSLETKSEIVVLIKRDGETLGEIDIDGHTEGAFTTDDERFLEAVGALIADRWDEEPEP